MSRVSAKTHAETAHKAENRRVFNAMCQFIRTKLEEVGEISVEFIEYKMMKQFGASPRFVQNNLKYIIFELAEHNMSAKIEGDRVVRV
jgi:transcriptional antiterminator